MTKKIFSISFQKSKLSTPASEIFPRISLEALRSVKLKKTSSILKETSPVKAKSPKKYSFPLYSVTERHSNIIYFSVK